MKTTIDLPDELFRELKEFARTRRVPMRELLVDGLRAELQRRGRAPSRVDFVFTTADGEGLQPDVDLTELTDRAYDLPPA